MMWAEEVQVLVGGTGNAADETTEKARRKWKKGS
jgi:hypothetical protein